MSADLARIGIHTVADLTKRRIGDKASLDAFFASRPVPANSDLFPYVDLNAARLRFMQRAAMEFPALLTLPVPVIDILAAGKGSPDTELPSGGGITERDSLLRDARAIQRAMLADNPDSLPPASARTLLLLDMSAEQCRFEEARAVWRRTAWELSNRTTPYLAPSESTPLWDKVRSRACYRAPGVHRTWTDLLAALATRDPHAIANAGATLLNEAGSNMTPEELTFTVTAVAAADVSRGAPERAQQVLRSLWARLDHDSAYEMSLQRLLALTQPVGHGSLP